MGYSESLTRMETSRGTLRCVGVSPSLRYIGRQRQRSTVNSEHLSVDGALYIRRREGKYSMLISKSATLERMYCMCFNYCECSLQPNRKHVPLA